MHNDFIIYYLNSSNFDKKDFLKKFLGYKFLLYYNMEYEKNLAIEKLKNFLNYKLTFYSD